MRNFLPAAENFVKSRLLEKAQRFHQQRDQLADLYRHFETVYAITRQKRKSFTGPRSEFARLKQAGGSLVSDEEHLFLLMVYCLRFRHKLLSFNATSQRHLWGGPYLYRLKVTIVCYKYTSKNGCQINRTVLASYTDEQFVRIF